MFYLGCILSLCFVMLNHIVIQIINVKTVKLHLNVKFFIVKSHLPSHFLSMSRVANEAEKKGPLSTILIVLPIHEMTTDW